MNDETNETGPASGGGKIERLALDAFLIPAQPGLDPIRVMLQDIGPGEGRIIIGCYGNAWECYWGAMGAERIRDFVANAEADYVANALSRGRSTSTFEDEYLKRVVMAVQVALKEYGRVGGEPGETPRTDAETFYAPTRENPHIWNRPVVDYEFCRTLERENAALSAEVERLRGLLREMADANNVDDPCEYDHNGRCQSHWLYERPCLAERVREALRAEAGKEGA